MGVTLLWAIKMRCTECPFNQWFISQIMVSTLNWFLVPSNKPLSNQILQWKNWFCLKFHVTDRLNPARLYGMCSVLFNFLKVELICTKQNLQNILCRLPSLFIHNKQTQLGVLSKSGLELEPNPRFQFLPPHKIGPVSGLSHPGRR